MIYTKRNIVINVFNLVVQEGNEIYEHTHTNCYTHMHTHIHKDCYTHMHTCTHTKTAIHTYIHTYTFTHSYRHTHTHKRTYIHTHVPLVLGELPLVPLRALGMRLMLSCGVLET